MVDVMAVVCAAHHLPMVLIDHGAGRSRWVCRECDREATGAIEAKAAYRRADAWARNSGSPYGGESR